MKYIDIENWERKEHYKHFKDLDYPHFNICANLDITEFYAFIKREEYPFFISVLYAASKTANGIKEFRYRIRGERVVEHETVNPSFTLMTSKGVFSYCPTKFIDNFSDFKEYTSKTMEEVKEKVTLEDEKGRDDFLFITSIPWISFTNMTHPIHMNPVDSIPRITWGKFFEENGKIKLPFSVQAHHALVDGAHMGEYFNSIQEILSSPVNFYK